MALNYAAPNIAAQPEFIAFVHDQETADLVLLSVQTGDIPKPLVRIGGVHAALEQITPDSAPRILLVDVHDSATAMSDIGVLASVLGPNCRIIVLGTVNDVHLFRNLISAGAADYLVRPFDEHQLNLALKASSQSAEVKSLVPRGKIAAFIGTRGGLGVTSTALSCAWLLAERQKQKVAFLDFDLQFGTASLALNLPPNRALREVLERPARVDGLFIERALERFSDNLSLLSGEEPLGELLPYDAGAPSVLLSRLNEKFDWVIIDLPRFATQMHRHVLSLVDWTIVLTEPGLAGVRDGIRINNLLRESAPKAQTIILTVDRSTGKGEQLSTQDLTKSLGFAPLGKIAWEPSLAATALGLGKPISAHSNAKKINNDYQKILDRITEKVESKTRFLAKILKRRSNG